MRATILILTGLLSGLLALNACAPATPSGPSDGRNACAPSRTLEPTCGVLWGISTDQPALERLEAIEQRVGREFDLVYRYHDINDPIPDETELQQVADGRILHLAIAARIYGAPNTHVTYADIAAGRYDDGLRRQARGVASMKTPVFVTFEQEANQRRKLGVRGTATEFRQAWRHVHDLYAHAGATNAVWVWVMTGRAQNLDRAGQLWPGNDVVDWISWNVYNQSGCHSGEVKPSEFTSFESAVEPFYHWVRSSGPVLGIDPDKPMMISESGSVLYTDNPSKTAQWYEQIPATLKEFPQIKAVALWNSQTSAACDYRIQRNSAVLAAVTGVGQNPYISGHEAN